MKAFYIISILIVALMALAPYPLIWIAEHGEKNIDEIFDRVVIGYDDDGRPIYNNNPTIRFDSYRAKVSSIDPVTCGDTTSAMVQGYIYEGLYTYHYLKRPLELEPLLADAMPTVSDDGLVYTIPIRRGVMFSRNPCFGEDTHGRWATREVTAHDFVFAFKRTADPLIDEGGLARTFLLNRVVGFHDYYTSLIDNTTRNISRYDAPLEGVRAIDDYTLEIRLVEPFPQLVYVLALNNVAPIPPEAVRYWLTGTNQMSFIEAEQVVGTGAYLLHQLRDERPIVFVRNPDFRPMVYPAEGTEEDRLAGRLDDAGLPVPFIDVVHLEYIEEDMPAWQRFLHGRLDSSGVSKEVFDQVITPDRHLSSELRAKGISLHVYESPMIYWLAFHMADDVMRASPSLRRAISLAYDTDTYLRLLYNGRGRPAVNCIPASMEALNASSYEAHQQAGQGEYYRFDLAEARRLLAPARDELGQAGLLDNGEIPTLHVYMPGRSQRFVDMGEFTFQQFNALGLDVTIHYNSWPIHQQLVNRGEAQIFYMGWHADYPDAENFLQLFYSGNYTGGEPPYRNEEFDALYERARVMPDTPERTALYARMASIINEEVPLRVLTEPQSYLLTYDWLRNVKPHPVGYGYGMYLRIDTDLRRRLGGRER
jgi:oligopeptide transport system substrate-binding protein